jgi:(p)ppGpp synthase/HD superfamily hydrolase
VHETELPLEMMCDHLISRARQWAEFYHGAQLYGGYPYIRHLDAVAMTLWLNGYNTPTWIAAGFLHDILEDTPCTVEKLLKPGKFSGAIIDLVEAVSGDPSLSRGEHCEMMYRKIFKHKEAAVLKIADRVCSLQALKDRLLKRGQGLYNDDQKYLNLSMNYIHEHGRFIEAVVSRAPPHMKTLYWEMYDPFQNAYLDAQEGVATKTGDEN